MRDTTTQLFKASPTTIGTQTLDDAQLELSQVRASHRDLPQEELRDARQGREPERDERLWDVGEDQEYARGEGARGYGSAFQLQRLEVHLVEREGPLLDYLHGR